MEVAGVKHAAHASSTDSTAAVDAFMHDLDHPLATLIQAIRAAILAVDSGIAEGVKWNAPSFRTSEYFATTNLRENNGVGIILHLGAKARELPPDGIAIDDPTQQLKWLGQDRAMIVFADLDDFGARQAAFTDIVRSWLAYV